VEVLRGIFVPGDGGLAVVGVNLDDRLVDEHPQPKGLAGSGRKLGLILNVLCVDGFIPKGKYVIDTSAPPNPIVRYTAGTMVTTASCRSLIRPGPGSACGFGQRVGKRLWPRLLAGSEEAATRRRPSAHPSVTLGGCASRNGQGKCRTSLRDSGSTGAGVRMRVHLEDADLYSLRFKP